MSSVTDSASRTTAARGGESAVTLAPPLARSGGTSVPPEEDLLVDNRRWAMMLGLVEYKRSHFGAPFEDDARASSPHVCVASEIGRSSFAVPLDKAKQMLGLQRQLSAERVGGGFDFSCVVKNVAKTKLVLDIDCMACKRKTAGRSHEFSGSALLRTVLVELYLGRGLRVEKGLYVTRGRTCGIHVFVNGHAFTEETKDELAARIAKRLKIDGRDAALDTGCRRIPWPLARHRKSVTAVRVNWEDGAKPVVRFYPQRAPFSDKVLRAVSNFDDPYAETETGARDALRMVENKQTVKGAVAARASSPVVHEEETNNATTTSAAVAAAPAKLHTAQQKKRKCASVATVPAERPSYELTRKRPHSVVDGETDAKRQKAVARVSPILVPVAARHGSDSAAVTQPITERIGGGRCPSPTSGSRARGRRVLLRPRALSTSSSSSVSDEEQRPTSPPQPQPPPSTVSTVNTVALSSLLPPRAPPPPSPQLQSPSQHRVTPRTSMGAAAAASEHGTYSGAAASTLAGALPTLTTVCSFRRDIRPEHVVITERRTPTPTGAPGLPPPPPLSSTADARAPRQRPRLPASPDEFLSANGGGGGGACYTSLDDSNGLSRFPDKQYKLKMVRDEEEAFEQSKREILRRRGRKIYRVAGSSVNLKRKYQLLTDLSRVKRSVHADDIVPRPEWKRLLCAYYDDHMHNPVFLYIFVQVFKSDRVRNLFCDDYHAAAAAALESLLNCFKVPRGTATARVDGVIGVTLENGATCVSEPADADKVTAVKAAIRICTHLFDMATAVFSDVYRTVCSSNGRSLDLLNRTVIGRYEQERRDGFAFTAPLPPPPQQRPPLSPSRRWPHPRSPVTQARPNRVVVEEEEEEDGVEVHDSVSQAGADYEDNDYATPGRIRAGAQSASAAVPTAAAGQTKNVYCLLASMIDREYDNLGNASIYVLLNYYHLLPIEAVERLLAETKYTGLMVTAVIRYFLKTYYTVEPMGAAFNGFYQALYHVNGCNHLRRQKEKSGAATAAANRRNGRQQQQQQQQQQQRRAQEEQRSPLYLWSVKDVTDTIIKHYLRPLKLSDNTYVFGGNGTHDVKEEDAVDLCHERFNMKKSEAQSAFKELRTDFTMPHGCQLVYGSDIWSEALDCRFHINASLNIYEMMVGGCVTQMTRTLQDRLMDYSRFNMTFYDVVAECRTASKELTYSIDRSYVNLLLKQPIVPPVFETELSVRSMYMDTENVEKGMFCCLNVMDYVRAINLFERENCHTAGASKNADAVEHFLDDIVKNNFLGACDARAAANFRWAYVFYLTYLYETLYRLQRIAVNERRHVALERLARDLDIKQLLTLFFDRSEFERVEGLDADLDERLRNAAADATYTAARGGRRCDGGTGVERRGANAVTARGAQDARPMVCAELPDKTKRMMELFGQFGLQLAPPDRRDNDENQSGPSGGRRTKYDGEPAAPPPMAGENEQQELTTSMGSGSGCGSGGAGIDDDIGDSDKTIYAADTWYASLKRRVELSTRSGPGHASSSRHPRNHHKGRWSSRERVNSAETVGTLMRLELKRHVDADRLGMLKRAVDEPEPAAARAGVTGTFHFLNALPMRIKMFAFVMTTHTVKRRSTLLAERLLTEEYALDRTGIFDDDDEEGAAAATAATPPNREEVWRENVRLMLNDRRALLAYARQLADERFPENFFVGLDPAHVYDILYDYMKARGAEYPVFNMCAQAERCHNADQDYARAARALAASMMFLLVMSAYDQEHVELYLKTFLSVEWPGQWAKKIFVWESNSNAGKSYLFDSIVKQACGNATCINDPKTGKENAPEKADYTRNFALFTHEFSNAVPAELKRLISDSTYKFCLKYANTMNEAYVLGKCLFNCNTLPVSTDEALINRMVLFNVPFWFSKRYKISDALFNWMVLCWSGADPDDADDEKSRWECAYRGELPDLLTEAERLYFADNPSTRAESDLFDRDGAARAVSANRYATAEASLFLVQNKTSCVYVASNPPTSAIVRGIVNTTKHFSWLRYFNTLEIPVDFGVLPAASQRIKNEWQKVTLPYQEWKTLTGATVCVDPSSNSVPVHVINESLRCYAAKSQKSTFFELKQFFESDFSAARDASTNEYYIRFNNLDMDK